MKFERCLPFILVLSLPANGAEGEGKKESSKKSKEGVFYAIPGLDLDQLTPEENLAILLTELKKLKVSIGGTYQVYEKKGIAPKNTLAETAFDKALETFQKNSYEATVLNLRDYLNLRNEPDMSKYIKAQYMLGVSYQKTSRPEQAIRAYSRYLATLTTNPHHLNKTAIHVVSNILSVVKQNPTQQPFSLKDLMAALTTLDLKGESAAWLYFYAGKFARHQGLREQAARWLDQALSTSLDDRLRARILYNQALLSLTQAGFSKAESALKAVLDKETSDFDFIHWARLTLARINIHLKKPKTALRYYEEVKSDSKAFKEALFEKTYVHLSLSQADEAVISAKEFLLRFPEDENVYQIRTIKAYLDLKANDLEEATQSIKNGEDRLIALSNWLTDQYGDRDTLSSLDVFHLIRATHAELPQPPAILEGKKIYHRLQSVDQRVSDLRNDMRNIIYTLGRFNPSELMPRWQNRLSQLEAWLIAILDLGDALVQTEGEIFRSKLSAKDAYMLDSSFKRRRRSLSTIAHFNRSKGAHRDWSELGELLIRTKKDLQRIKSIQASLAAMNWLTNSASVRRAQKRLSEISTYSHKASELESQLLRALEIIRARQAITSVRMSRVYSLKALAKEQAEGLLSDQTVLLAYRDQFPTSQSRHLHDDLYEAWGLFEYVLQQAYEQLLLLEKDMLKTTRQRLGHFDTLVKTHQDLLEELDETKSRLSRTLGKHMYEILAHYRSQINERRAKHGKWLADINWLKFQLKTEEKKAVHAKYELEQQILKENLKDLEQGALWQWPKY